MSFNFIDALLLVVILVSVFGGWRRGFILSSSDLLRWLGSLLIALYFYQPVSRLLERVTDLTSVWTQPISFIFVVIVVSITIQSLSFMLLKRLPREVHKNRVNQFLGTLPGLANGVITATIIAAILFSLPLSERLNESVRQSRTANRLAVFTEDLEAILNPIFGKAIEQTLNRLMVEPGSDKRIDLPFKVENSRPRPDLEAQMLELVNRERKAAGLSPLAPDPELTEVARKHSADMFVRSYFSHNTPEGKTPFDRMHDDGVRFITAGENLALAPSLPIAHNGLMNSPGHRANILRPQFGRLGIGIMDGGRRGLMVSQEFRN